MDKFMKKARKLVDLDSFEDTCRNCAFYPGDDSGVSSLCLAPWSDIRFKSCGGDIDPCYEGVYRYLSGKPARHLKQLLDKGADWVRIREKEDKRIWSRMGRELAALHDLILKIQCDLEYQAVMDTKTWDKLDKLTYYLDIVRGSAENRMAKYVPDWSTRTFYPVDRDAMNAAIAEFRQKMEEDTTHD